jgi:hypothetical protein
MKTALSDWVSVSVSCQATTAGTLLMRALRSTLDDDWGDDSRQARDIIALSIRKIDYEHAQAAGVRSPCTSVSTFIPRKHERAPSFLRL